MSANDSIVTACWVALKDHGQIGLRVDPDAFRASLSAAGYAVVPSELVRELADDLAAHIAAHYGNSTGYPSMDRKRAADMEIVNRAREALASSEPQP